MASANVIETDTDTGEDLPARLLTEDDYPAFFGSMLPTTVIRLLELETQVSDLTDQLGAMTIQRDELQAQIDAAAAEAISTVSRVQAKLALHAAGISDETVEAAIDALDEPQRTQATLAWEQAPTFSRSSAFVAILGDGIGLDDQAIDALFIAAAEIEL